MTSKRRFPKSATLYALAGTFMGVLWILTDDTDALIIAAWFAIMSKLEEMSATRSVPLSGDVWISANESDWANITQGPRDGAR